MPYRVVLCLGGIGMVVTNALRATGYGVLSLDGNRDGASQLWRPTVRRRVEGWITSGCALAVIAGSPVGPQVANDATAAFHDHVSAIMGQLLRRAHSVGIPALAVAPPADRIWHAPGWRTLVGLASASVRTDTCCWRARWRTGLRVTGWHAGYLDSLRVRCGGRDGWCSITGRPHIVVATNGKPRPGGSAPWPRDHAAELASIVTEAAEGRRAATWAAHALRIGT